MEPSHTFSFNEVIISYNPLSFPTSTEEYETLNKSCIRAINNESIYVARSLYTEEPSGYLLYVTTLYPSRTTRFPPPGVRGRSRCTRGAGSLILQKEQLTDAVHSSSKRMVSVVGFEKTGLIAPRGTSMA